MPTTRTLPSVEEQRAYIAALRHGYEQTAHELFRRWEPPSEAAKLAFDRLMQDAYLHRKSARPCTMPLWYSHLLGKTHE